MDHENPEEALDNQDFQEYELLESEIDNEQEEDIPQLAEGPLYAYQDIDGWHRAVRASRLKALANHKILPLDTAIVKESKEKLIKGDHQLDFSQKKTLEELVEESPETYTIQYAGASPAKVVGKLKNFNDGLIKINTALEKYGKFVKEMNLAAEKGAQVSGTLSKINQFMAHTKAFSKISSALGMFGAGLGLASGIIGLFGEDANAAMFRALNQINSQLNEIKDSIEDLKKDAKYNHAITRIEGPISDINTGFHLLELRKKNIDNKNVGAVKDYDKRLIKLGRNTIQRAVQKIRDQACGLVIETDNNIFKVQFDRTYGDFRIIRDLGSYLLLMASKGLMVDAAIGKILYEGKQDEVANMQAAADTASQIYGDLIKDIEEAFHKWLKKCVNLGPNANQYIQRNLPKLRGKDYQSKADHLRSLLERKWFWVDWIILVYAPVGRSNYHYMIGHQFLKHFRKEIGHGKEKQKVNLVAHWVPHEFEVKQKVFDFSSWSKIHLIASTNIQGLLNTGRLLKELVKAQQVPSLIWVGAGNPFDGWFANHWIHSLAISQPKHVKYWKVKVRPTGKQVNDYLLIIPKKWILKGIHR